MLKYDDVDVGAPLGPEEHEITREVAADYHESIETRHPRLAGDDSGLVEASILGRFGMRLVTGTYTGEGMIHAKQSFEFEGPVRVGDVVVATGEFSEKYERRGRKYVSAEAEFHTDSGRDLGRTSTTWVVEATG